MEHVNVSSIDPWPKSFTVGVQAGLIGIDSFSAFLLTISLLLTEDASHLLLVGVVAGGCWISMKIGSGFLCSYSGHESSGDFTLTESADFVVENCSKVDFV